MKKLAKLSVVLILLLMIGVSTIGCVFLEGDGNDTPSVNPAQPTNTVVVFNSGSTERQKMDVVDAIEKVSRSVVAIKMQIDEESASYGSGIIVNVKRLDENEQDVDGENVFYILTCHHVISDAGNVTVYVPDEEGDNFGEHDYNSDYEFTGKIGETFSGEVTLVGGDLNSDVALLRLDLSGTNVTSDKIVKADLAPTSGYAMRVGESVFAIGNPSGRLPGTVTVGTIAYLNREVTVGSVGDMTLTQINTDIYHGSSGGALFNLYGEVIGITNSGSDKYSGINYAIPFVIDAENGDNDNGFINIIKKLLGTYTGENYGYVYGRIEKFGFTAQESEEKVIVSDVTVGSQAHLQGIVKQDYIRKAQILRATVGQNGQVSYSPDFTVEISSLSKLSEVMQSLKVLDKVVLSIGREGYANEVKITLIAKQAIFCDTGIY